MITEAYPLQWPLGWKRTSHPGPSSFGYADNKPTIHRATQELLRQIQLLPGTNIVVSSQLRDYARTAFRSVGNGHHLVRSPACLRHLYARTSKGSLPKAGETLPPGPLLLIQQAYQQGLSAHKVS